MEISVAQRLMGRWRRPRSRALMANIRCPTSVATECFDLRPGIAIDQSTMPSRSQPTGSHRPIRSRQPASAPASDVIAPTVQRRPTLAGPFDGFKSPPSSGIHPQPSSTSLSNPPHHPSLALPPLLLYPPTVRPYLRPSSTFYSDHPYFLILPFLLALSPLPDPSQLCFAISPYLSPPIYPSSMHPLQIHSVCIGALLESSRKSFFAKQTFR